MAALASFTILLASFVVDPISTLAHPTSGGHVPFHSELCRVSTDLLEQAVNYSH